MPDVPFSYLGLVQLLEDGPELVEALLHPEFVRFGRGSNFARRAVVQNVERRLERLELQELHARIPPTEATVGRVQLQVPPPKKSAAWRGALALELPTVQWRQGRVDVTYVPALGIEVLSHDPSAVEKEVRSALTRKGLAGHLRELALLQRHREVRLAPGKVQVHLKTLRERARERQDGKPKRDVLPAVADRVTTGVAWERDAEVARLKELLQERSVLLVGPSGVGKTAIAHAAAGPGFWETSGSRLMASGGGFGGWQERCRRVWLEARDTKAVLLLGNLLELREVGRHATSPQGLAGFFRTALERGDFRAVVELTPEGRTLLEREDPHLLQAFAILEVEPPSAEVTRRILARCHPGADVDLVERLHRRFATYSAAPGRPLRFLRNLQGREVTRAFSDETGLPLFLIEETEFLDLAETERWFESRVLGQPEACRLVVDLLATAKAALNRPRRPIASLLMVGPTGTGKTEMARSLAEFLYRDRTRMVRFDMSEYADPVAVARLVGGGAQGQGLLTGRVREEPFGVVLFDELEKADPSFFDLLLQVLGEGRLTDAGGRLADFSNTLVLMTSNLGADTFRRGPLGFVTRASGDFLGAVRSAFRPELFNRLDRIVPFAPLDAATVEGIARRELEAIRQREGLRYRDLVLEVGPEVAPHLARVGFDRLYGARPLKRAVEREVLAPLAHGLNRYAAEVPLRADVLVADGRVQVQVKAREAGAAETLRRQATTEEAAAVTAAVELRRKVGRLAQGPSARELQNQLYRLERRKDDPKGAARLKRLRQRLEEVVARAEGLEEDALLAVHGHGALDPVALVASVEEGRRQYRDVLLDLYALQFPEADRAVVGVYSEEPAALAEYGRAYLAAARQWGMEATALAVRPCHDEETGTRLAAWPIEAVPARGAVGLILEFRGRLAAPRFLGEAGMHMLSGLRVLVHTSPELLGDYEPPPGVHRRGAMEGPAKRRAWYLESRAVEDAALGRVGLPAGATLLGSLAGVMEAGLERAAEEGVAS